MSVRVLLPLVLYLFLFVGPPASGQADSCSGRRQRSYLDKDYFRSYLRDAGDIATSPVRWNSYQWIGVSAILGTTVVLFTQDRVIQDWIQDNQTPALDHVTTYIFEPMGSGLYTLPAMGILYGCGFIFHDDRAKLTALRGVEAFILATATSQILKHLTHRHRPDQEVPPDPWIWEGPFSGFQYTSFPSGHATAVFAVATVVATSYQRTVWVPILCYTLATCTALSRVYDDRHWVSDVVVGSALGFAIGKLVVRNDRKIKVLPVTPAGPGVSIVYSF